MTTTKTNARYILFMIALLFVGCCSHGELYEAADAFHDSVAEPYKSYIKEDESLDEDKKKEKILNIDLHGKALKRYKEVYLR